MSSLDSHSQQERFYPGRREFIRSLGAAGLTLAASGMRAFGLTTKGKPQLKKPLVDPEAPLRIGMMGRIGHLGVVFGDLDKIPNVRIAAYAFEDGQWEFNSDGTKRGRTYDMDSQRKWAEKQAWYSSETKLYETYQEMLDKEKLDVAVACLPYARNAYAATCAAQHGVHVLSEKPVAVNYADLEMLEKAVKTSGVRLSAMFTLRFVPTIYSIKKAVSQGLVGKVCMAKGQKSYKFGESRPWYYKHREIFGSSILWVGIHAIDYIRWTTGLEVRKVSAFHGNLAHPDYPGCQDHGVVIMELEGGATAAMTLHRVCGSAGNKRPGHPGGTDNS